MEVPGIEPGASCVISSTTELYPPSLGSCDTKGSDEQNVASIFRELTV